MALGGETAVPLGRPVLRARRRRELGREHGGDEAGLADRPEGGDTVSIDTTYDVKRRRGTSRWESSPWRLRRPMTLRPRTRSRTQAVKKMYEKGGVLTHGRLPENIDRPARDKLGLPDPRDLRSRARDPRRGIDIDSFVYHRRLLGVGRPPLDPMRPPTVSPVRASASRAWTHCRQPQMDQAWHTVTSCKPPCNRGSGIGYPLADGPVKFDADRAPHERVDPAEVRVRLPGLVSGGVV